MYRNNSSGSFKSPMDDRQALSEMRKDDQRNVAESRESFEQTSVRSTKKILNLFKKPIASRNEEVTKENIPIAREEPNLVKQNLPAKKDLPAKQGLPTVPSNSKIIFNVVMGKMSTRKHKRWEDDGTLEVTGKYAILKDSDGNIIRRTTVNPEELVEGFRMCLDNKQIEIIDRATSEGLAEKDASARERIPEPPAKKLKTSSSTPFLPLGSLRKGVVVRDPLVMPSINISKDWTKDIPAKETEVSVDSCLVNALRTHQRHGIVFLYECIVGSKVPDYFGAILADEMGLGKTLQCITIIWTLLRKGPHGRPTLKNVLIVTPSSLCSNWNKEFKQWLGFHRICPYVVDAKNKPKDFKKHMRNSVMIISYDMLIRCREEIEGIEFDLMVCDEGHRLKNNDIKAAKILCSLTCKRRILLTGTPVQNDLQEFFALIDFVNPGILGSNSEFKSYYENPIVASRCPNATEHVLFLGTERANELHEKTKPFVLRRTQETINKYLPSKHELIVFCRLSDEQKDLYSRVTDSWFNTSALESNSVPPLTIITTLKKICNHPELFYNDKNKALHSALKKPSGNFKASYHGKVSIVQTLMRNLKKTDEKLLLISYYTRTLDLLENVCIAESSEFLRLDGSTTSSARSKIIERFNSKSDNSKVLLLSAKAGGVGLNLPGASRLVLFDSDWNPASDSQAMARIWRDGQKKDVYVIRLLTTGTIEEKILQRQISKAGLSETVMDINSFASMKLSNTELKDLFTLTTNTACLTHDLMKCSCDGRKTVEEPSKASDQRNDREYQFVVEDDAASKSNLSINQLLKWEHHRQPFPDQMIKEIMLSEESENVTFILKNSVLNKAR